MLKVFEKEQLLARAQMLGERLRTRMQAIARKHRSVGEVRGLGAMVAMELVENGDAHAPATELTRKLVAEAARRGLILLSCGSYANIVRVLVPLTASDAIIDEGMQILEASFEAVSTAG